jgi:VWFA-related protein
VSPILCALLLFQQAPQQVPTFASEARAVEVDVLVTQAGKPVVGLTAGDFEILDDGVRQEVELVAGPGAPANVVLALDVSESVAGDRLAQLEAAVGAMLDGLRPGDHATLLTFADQVRLAVPSTTDVASLRAALAAATSGGSTALNDAIFAGFQLADRRNGRPVLMVFTDGEDRSSWLGDAELRQAARRADTVLYGAELPAPATAAPPKLSDMQSRADPNEGPELARNRRRPAQDGRRPRTAGTSTELERLVSLTGGKIWSASSGAELRQAFLSLLEEVRGRYLLRFEPAAAGTKGWHDLDVKVRGKGQVRARRGYHDGAR